ncbi:cytochrome P450 4V3 [Culex quinquefasciatus]|uniref:Cytochrome P450 4V3 n=1 Tax=Culex quinquefasciatus TaxID=7176 RepID=B0XDU2_CULQU|nr:cytochrome P450 4V3 [Culex quinquefasciatus]|eukprot:XP_001867814.1 cytochrome P450 4V3 [Culex quinquefasciatus]
MYGVCFVLVMILISVYYQWSRRKIVAAVANMDGPPSLPLIGNLFILLKYNTGEKIFNYVSSIGRSYRYPISIHIGPLLYVLLDNPDHLKTVLNSKHCLDKLGMYEFFDVNRGLLVAKGHVWKGLRKNLNHSFGKAIVSDVARTFNTKSTILVENLEKYVGQGEHDLSNDFVKCFLDTILNTAFGVNLDLQRTPLGDELVKVAEKYLELTTKRMFYPLQYSDLLYRFTNDCKIHRENLTYLRDFSEKVLDIKAQSDKPSAPSDQKQAEEDIANGRKPLIFLDSLLDLARKSDNFTKEDIIDNMITIIEAGNDTTATTLKMVFLMLAIHPDIQERVHEEILRVCPDTDQFVSMEDASALSYIETVCKEVWRLYPVGPFVGRVATLDIKLDDKHTIPADSQILINFHHLHRNPSTWGPDADKFNPDRFLPENCTQRHPYAFLPFSAGPRNCIGLRYAWLSLKIIMVHVLRRYRLRTTLTMDQIKIRFSVVTRILNGCPISLEER